MKKLILLFVSVYFIIFSSYCFADSIELGKKLPIWKSLLNGNDLSLLEPTKNKVLTIHYIDPRHKDENEPASIAIRNAIVDGRLVLKDFQPIAIVDCAASWAPNYLIKKYANAASEKMPQLKTIMLFDYDGILNKKYGNTQNTDDYTALILTDKQGICRAIYYGKMSKKQIVELIDLAVKLQYVPYKRSTENKEKKQMGENFNIIKLILEF